jgi:hypothetical protein
MVIAVSQLDVLRTTTLAHSRPSLGRFSWQGGRVGGAGTFLRLCERVRDGRCLCGVSSFSLAEGMLPAKIFTEFVAMCGRESLFVFGRESLFVFGRESLFVFVQHLKRSPLYVKERGGSLVEAIDQGLIYWARAKKFFDCLMF